MKEGFYMFAFLKGEISLIKKDFIAIDVAGVGYKVFTANPYAFEIGALTTVYTHQVVTENDLSLYGFKTIDELDLFTSLINARGIGPKTACAILATGDMDGLANAITAGDAQYLTKFPKIGPKTASQIILDLQGKLDVSGISTTSVMSKSGNLDEALEALEALGYSTKELKKVQTALKSSTDSVDGLIRQGLQLMMR